jgi:hypothetical protein
VRRIERREIVGVTICPVVALHGNGSDGPDESYHDDEEKWLVVSAS